MTDRRSFFFAVKPGAEPVQVSGKTAHARLPWVAQGYEVFEWVWVDGVHWAAMLRPELDRLCEFCRANRTDYRLDTDPVIPIQRKAEAIIYEQASFRAAS